MSVLFTACFLSCVCISSDCVLGKCRADESTSERLSRLGVQPGRCDSEEEIESLSRTGRIYVLREILPQMKRGSVLTRVRAKGLSKQQTVCESREVKQTDALSVA